jgi:hypothetical protein
MKTVYVLIGILYNETGRDAYETLLVTTDPELVIPERERVRAQGIFDHIIFEEHELVEPVEEVV